MIYVLAVIVVVQNFIIGFQLYLAKQERSELNDRIMALSNPLALSAMPAKVEPGEVTYVDENREAELSPSWSAG